MLTGTLLAVCALLSPQPQEEVDGPLFVERQTRIERHALLGELDLLLAELDGGLEVYTQRSTRDRTRSIEQLTSILQSTEAAFDRRFAVPSGLKAERARGPVAVVLLDQQPLYERYLKAAGDFCTYSHRVNYDARLGAVVLLDSISSGEPAELALARTALHHAYVHALYHAYAGTDRRLIGPYWLTEGIALHLIASKGDGGPPVEGPGLPHLSTLLSERLLDGGFPRKKLLPLAQLMGFPDRATFREWVLASSPERDEYKSYWEREKVLAFQAACLLDLIVEQGGSAQEANLLAQFKLAVTGQEPAGPPEFGFGPGGLDRLEQRLWEVLLARHFGGCPTEAPKPPVGAPEAVQAAFARVTEGLLDAEGRPLALLPDDPAWTLERAADDLASGRFGSARELLASLEFPEGAEDNERIVRLAELAGELAELRDEGIAALAAEGGRLRIEHEGKARNMRIEALVGSTLTLRIKRGETRTIELDELPLVTLSRALGDAASPRADLALAFLARESRWDRDLPEDLARLAGDLESLEPLFMSGSHKNALADLDRRTGGVLDRAGAREALADLRQLEAAIEGGFPGLLSEKHLPLLRDRARKILGAAHGHDSVGQDLGSGVARIEGDRLILEYDFEEEAQLEDFLLDDTFHLGERRSVGDVAASTRPHARISGGTLDLLGSQGLRHHLELSAPLSVSWSLTVRDSKPEDNLAMFGLVLLDSRSGHFISIANRITAVTFFRSGQPLQELGDAPTMYYPNMTYDLAFEVDASGRMTGTYNGETAFEDVADPPAAGAWGLFTQTNHRVLVDDLRIEAPLTEELMASARASWVELGLVDLGLDPGTPLPESAR
jgi:hypothetical protein